MLAQADKLSEQLDVTSVSEEARSLIASERERAYRGEDFEKLMISTLQALNYAQLGKDEDALVEVRRVNERMQRMISEEKKPYEQLAIARYLTGVLWEDQGTPTTRSSTTWRPTELAGDLGTLAEPLVRLAKETGRDQALKELRRQYPWVQPQPLGQDEGQILVVLEAGKAPVKTNGTQEAAVRRREVIAVPVFRDRPWIRGLTGGAATEMRTRRCGPPRSPRWSRWRDSTSTTASDGLVARQVGRARAAGGVSPRGRGRRRRARRVGILTFIALSYANQPDLRSWMSLPAEFQLARFRVPAGRRTGSPCWPAAAPARSRWTCGPGG